MEKKSDSIAWLAKQDGTVVMGYGPFAASAEPCPADVSFYVQNFGLEDPLPWKTPSCIERTTTLKLASQIKNFIPLECKWSPLDAARFAEVFQEIMNSINGGILEKTVPVVTEIAKTLGSPPLRGILPDPKVQRERQIQLGSPAAAAILIEAP